MRARVCVCVSIQKKRKKILLTGYFLVNATQVYIKTEKGIKTISYTVIYKCVCVSMYVIIYLYLYLYIYIYIIYIYI